MTNPPYRGKTGQARARGASDGKNTSRQSGGLFGPKSSSGGGGGGGGGDNNNKGCLAKILGLMILGFLLFIIAIPVTINKFN